jgi:hypothetical protein
VKKIVIYLKIRMNIAGGKPEGKQMLSTYALEVVKVL